MWLRRSLKKLNELTRIKNSNSKLKKKNNNTHLLCVDMIPCGDTFERHQFFSGHSSLKDGRISIRGSESEKMCVTNIKSVSKLRIIITLIIKSQGLSWLMVCQFIDLQDLCSSEMTPHVWCCSDKDMQVLIFYKLISFMHKVLIWKVSSAERANCTSVTYHCTSYRLY